MGSAWCNPDRSDVNLRRVALADLGAIYLPAADAIARCSTENSFKIIALKGLLQHQIDEVKLRGKKGKPYRHRRKLQENVDDPALVELSDAHPSDGPDGFPLKSCQLLASGE